MIKLIYLSIISGVFFFLSWPTNFKLLTPLIFLTFIPLLLIENKIRSNKKNSLYIILYSYFSFFIFNFSCTIWVENASPAFGEGLIAVLLNSFFMSIVFYLFHISLKKINFISPIFFLSGYWIFFEILHMNWDLNWPWLTLGNVFSEFPILIQWYSYTGVLGGSLWVLIINYLIFKCYLNFLSKKTLKLNNILLVFFIPIFISTGIYISSNFQGKKINILVAQSNIDPNLEKFSSQAQRIEKTVFYELTENINDSINYVIFPETFLSSTFTISNNETINYNRNQISHITRLVEQYPNLNIIIGATVYHFLDGYKDYKQRNYKLYNSSLQFNSSGINFYHKSKLVPGAEQLPYKNYLKFFLNENFLKLAGGAGNLSKQDSITLFSSNENKIASLICYESVFPNHVRKFVKKGAQAIFIITNDGWWGDTQGRKQHNSYARIRAIETRRYVARSANTGISSVINPLGQFEKVLEPNTSGSFIHPIELLSFKTFYVKHGNILIFIYLVILLFFGLIKKYRN